MSRRALSDRCAEHAALLCLALTIACGVLWAQAPAAGGEREYPFAPEKVRKALEQAGAYSGQRLPMLDGFVSADAGQLDQYEKPYFQYRIHLVPASAGSTRVKIEARITAQYAAAGTHALQYRALPSNGRLETDMLDRLAETLGIRGELDAGGSPASSPAGGFPAVLSPVTSAAVVAARERSVPLRPGTPQEQLDAVLRERQAVRERTAALRTQLVQLEGLVASAEPVKQYASVKRDGAGMMSRMSFGGPVLFRAQEGDEFEVVNQQQDWTLVRLGPSSTAWVQTDELEFPPGLLVKQEAKQNVEQEVSREAPADLGQQTAVPPVQTPGVRASSRSVGEANASSAAAQPDLGFWVSHEEVKAFSGDWSGLQGKKALFVYAQPRGLLTELFNDDRKLAFVKRVFASRYQTANRPNARFEGIVVIFMGGRGGVAAATVADIRQWSEGSVAEGTFLSRCSLDPADEFHGRALVSAGSGGVD
jgi:hypothetical protein